MKIKILLFILFGWFLSCNQEKKLPPGFPDRSPNLDVLPGFKTPPKGYGEVSFYWWLGDTLTKERIISQLDQLKDRSITGLQINYCHTDKGGATYGLTYPSQPALFSDEWWKLFEWFLVEAKKRDMSVSLSDYTLGAAGQGWFVDEMLNENPQLHGSKLEAKQLILLEIRISKQYFLPKFLMQQPTQLFTGNCKLQVKLICFRQSQIPNLNGRRLPETGK
jgi:hypothetical protein